MYSYDHNQSLSQNLRRNVELRLLFAVIIFFTFETFYFFTPIAFPRSDPRFLTTRHNKPLIFHTERYNWYGRRLNTPAALDYSDYPDAPILVIASLVTNHQVDVDKLCRALKSLTHLKGDIENFPTPVMVFNDGSLSNFQLEMIVQSTDRPIAFPLVNDLDSFPDGFKPTKDNNTDFHSNSRWFYPQMTQFWVHNIWKHSAIDAFDFIMRMDFDTCFHEDNEHLPDFGKQHKAYHAQYVGVEPDPSRVKGLYDFVASYMKKEGILPTNPLLWQLVSNSWTEKKTLPLYQVSLEVIRKSFMQHPDVMKFHEAVATRKPYGIFEYGWSDHVLRFIDTALFVSNENFMTAGFKGFHNRESCEAGPPPKNNDVNEASEEENTVEEEKEEDKLVEIIVTGGSAKDKESEERQIEKDEGIKPQDGIADSQEQDDVNESDTSITVNDASENLKRQERG